MKVRIYLINLQVCLQVCLTRDRGFIFFHTKNVFGKFFGNILVRKNINPRSRVNILQNILENILQNILENILVNCKGVLSFPLS